MYSLYDTIVAPSTARGLSALALVRLSGADAIRIAASCVSTPENLIAARERTAIYTDILDPAGESIDDTVCTLFRAPRSYTGEDLVEIACHGSTVIVDSIVARLQLAGARLAEPGEFTSRAVMNGRIELSEAEALAERFLASTEVQLKGAALRVAEKTARVQAIYDKLLNLLALVNAQIDFGETEDLPASELEPLHREILSELQRLIDSSNIGIANQGDLTVAFVGPPNAGKSSLFNALLQFERSIVSDAPGTTRDYVEAFFTLGQFKIRLVDTAGLRDTIEATEQKGITLGAEASDRAEIVLRITTPETRDITAAGHEILVHNKTDLDGHADGISVSALTGSGLERMESAIREAAEKLAEEGSVLRISAVERDILIATRDRMSFSLHEEPVLIADSLRSAIGALGELLGVNVSQETLHRIFSTMCIGK